MDPRYKITTLEAIARQRAQIATLAVINGCFDLLHRGHCELLNRAARYGTLLVLLNSDRSVRENKGAERPIVPEADRAYMLACMEAVRFVVLFDTLRITDQLRRLRPDIYLHGEDRQHSQPREERALLQALGTVTIWLPVVPGLSTTRVIERIRLDGPCS